MRKENLKQVQIKQITGTVTDNRGSMPGVTVSIKGTKTAVITDFDGKYEITASATDTLVFSFMGYKTIEMPVNTSTIINVRFQEDATNLQEVKVNAGYYSVKESERTGSIARITANDIETQPVTNVLAAMQGRMAGVDITQQTGAPGGGFDIRIRGINSLRSTGNAPLYIIDGVPFSSDAIGDRQTSTSLPSATSPLNTITPSAIASVEVLKDADATAIYGSRGANGVVLITTKKGKAGKTQFAVSSTTAVGQITRTTDLMGTPEYLMMREQAFANDGITTYPFNAYDVNGTWDRNQNTDWQKELTGGTAEIKTMQLSVSGGSAQTHFLLSGNTYSQGTVYPGDFDYKKGGVHLSLDHESIDKKFKVTFSGSYDIQDNDQPARDLTRISRNLAPNAPALYNADGTLNWENSSWENPLAALYAKALSKTNSLVTNGLFSYQLDYGFTAKTSFGFTDLQHHETRSNPSTIYDPIYQAAASYSSIYLTTTARQSWVIEPQLQWQKQLGKGKFDVLVGGTFQNETTNRLVQFGSGFTSNSLLYNLASASLSRTNFDDEILYMYQALFGRVNFSWQDKYFVNLTGRRDGSSRFGPGKQFANFGAVGMAWLFSEEKVIREDFSLLSFGKVRGSFGVTGNDQIGDYQYLDTYQSSTSVYDGTVGLRPIRLFNPNFSWESNQKIEAAIELGFLNDRIFTTAGWYHNRSSNQLIGMPLPSTTGFTTIQSNLDATVQNTGLELTLRTLNIQKDSFGWTTDINITFPKNKLIAFPGLATSSYRNQYVIGESINIQKLYHFSGVNPQTGIYEFEDVNGDGALSFADDAQTIRDFSPEYYGGVQNQLRYKRFQLDFLFQFVKQLNWNAASQYSAPGAFGNQPLTANGGWQQPGDNATMQIYTTGLNSAAVTAYGRYAYSNAAVSDASYIRLRNVAVSYSVPTYLKGLQCKLSLQAQNLLTITSYDDGDPEFRSFNYLPPLRVISLGAEIKF
ncbi:SusC/RagA family TonB-linked outer membrane protein [Flavobacterium sp. TMP13]|uniref:SusC/RagA family TonB-linked outer membrane protein n=1 Tax=Flavobacterium sp. TMP13 TaxID=3425950 RepID=UPI003D78081B